MREGKSKELQKKFKKALDKPTALWYNKSVRKRERTKGAAQKINTIFERKYFIMATKMTKRDYFALIRERVSDDADLVAFVDHEIELLDNKRNTPRPETKTQRENKEFQAAIVEYLTIVDAPMTIKDIQANIPALEGLSNQKMTHLLTPLVNDGVLVKTYEKKVPRYTIAQ